MSQQRREDSASEMETGKETSERTEKDKELEWLLGHKQILWEQKGLV